MKFVKFTIMVLMMLFLFSAAAAAAGPEVYLDSQVLYFDVDPVTENNHTLVPLRAIFEAMGANLTWDQESQTATAVNGDTTVVLTVGSTSPMINGQVQTLDIPAQVVNQHILAPLRFVGEAFGGTVSWDQAANKIDIVSKTAGTATPPSQAVLSITGEKLNAAMNYNLSDLKGMKDIILTDTYYSRGKAKENWAAASHNEYTGISLAGLLEQKVGLKDKPTRVIVKAEDGYTLMLSWDEANACYIDETNPDKQLTTILAWSQDGREFDPTVGSSLRLIMGQKYKGDYNRQRWVNNVQSITVE